MQFEWDEDKRATNLAKHRIDFRDVVSVFAGPVVTWDDDRFDYGELREITVGRMNNLLIVAIVHTDRSGRRRIISARPASRRERTIYEAAI